MRKTENWILVAAAVLALLTLGVVVASVQAACHQQRVVVFRRNAPVVIIDRRQRNIFDGQTQFAYRPASYQDFASSLDGADAPATSTSQPSGESTKVLANRCASCHSGESPKGGLDLTRPLNAAMIELVQDRILADDPEVRMPPPDKRPLSVAEKKLLLRLSENER